MNRLYKVGLLIEAPVSLLTALFSLLAINAFSFIYEGTFHGFALPTVAISLCCLLFAILGLLKAVTPKAAFWVVMPLGVAIFTTYCFAMSRWPGGDDGPGMLWLLFVGAGSSVMSLTGAVMIVLGAVLIMRKRNDT